MIGYKMLIKERLTGVLRFIVNGAVCDNEGMQTASGPQLKYDNEEGEYAAGFHYSASPTYGLYLTTVHQKEMKTRVVRHLGLDFSMFDVVVYKVRVADVYAKGTWWSDINEGDISYVAKHIEVLHEVGVEVQELCYV
jgi:hypothetical protein